MVNSSIVGSNMTELMMGHVNNTIISGFSTKSNDDVIVNHTFVRRTPTEEFWEWVSHISNAYTHMIT